MSTRKEVESFGPDAGALPADPDSWTVAQLRAHALAQTAAVFGAIATASGVANSDELGKLNPDTKALYETLSHGLTEVVSRVVTMASREPITTADAKKSAKPTREEIGALMTPAHFAEQQRRNEPVAGLRISAGNQHVTSGTIGKARG